MFKTCNQLELVYQPVHEVICIWKCHLESKQPQVSVRMCAQFSSKRRQPHLLNSTSCLWGNGCPRARALRNLFFLHLVKWRALQIKHTEPQALRVQKQKQLRQLSSEEAFPTLALAWLHSTAAAYSHYSLQENEKLRNFNCRHSKTYEQCHRNLLLLNFLSRPQSSNLICKHIKFIHAHLLTEPSLPVLTGNKLWETGFF